MASKYNGSYTHINSCFSLPFEDYALLPPGTRNAMDSYLKDRLGSEYYSRLVFMEGYAYSDEPIDMPVSEEYKTVMTLLGEEDKKEDCDTTGIYPLYSVDYLLPIPEKGIENIVLTLFMAENGTLVKDIEFPKREDIHKIIPIDSVHHELSRRENKDKKIKDQSLV